MSTTIAIQLPDDIANVLREKWGNDLSQRTLEAPHGYRSRTLSGATVDVHGLGMFTTPRTRRPAGMWTGAGPSFSQTQN